MIGTGMCPICCLVEDVCALAAKHTHNRCHLAHCSRWERKRVIGYCVTLDRVAPNLHVQDACGAFRTAIAHLVDDGGTRWILGLPDFLKRYRPKAEWDETVVIDVPEIPKEYRR